jgi:hypothetical protein
MPSSVDVLKPLISKLTEIAPNWSILNNRCRLLKYESGSRKMLHSDSNPAIFAPAGVNVDDSNRHKYMIQATLFLYLTTVESGDGGVTVFHDTDNTYALRPLAGHGVLHPCISANQESSVDKFVKVDTLSASPAVLCDGHSNDEYRCRDSAWYHESTELLKGEKYILVCSLVDATECVLDPPFVKPRPFVYRFDERSKYLTLFENYASLPPPVPVQMQILW